MRGEDLFERYGWTLFFGLSIVVTVFGLGDMISGAATNSAGEQARFQAVTGTTWPQLAAANPAIVAWIDFGARQSAADWIFLGLVTGFIALTALRRGERWAWFAMCLWPVWIASHVLIVSSAWKHPAPATPVPIISGSIFFVVALIGLGLTFRKAHRSAAVAGLAPRGGAEGP